MEYTEMIDMGKGLAAGIRAAKTAEDTAEVSTAPKEQNIFQRAFTALRNVFTDAVEYFT